MSQVPDDVKAIKEAFEQLLRDLSWATASQLPVGEELRERCAKAEQQIVCSWNERLYGDQHSGKRLAALVSDMRVLRGLRVAMEDPASPVPQLSPTVALNRAKRLIAAGAADEALHLLAAAKGSLDDATLKQLIPSDIPLPLTPEDSVQTTATSSLPADQQTVAAAPPVSPPLPTSEGTGAGNQVTLSPAPVTSPSENKSRAPLEWLARLFPTSAPARKDEVQKASSARHNASPATSLNNKGGKISRSSRSENGSPPKRANSWLLWVMWGGGILILFVCLGGIWMTVVALNPTATPTSTSVATVSPTKTPNPSATPITPTAVVATTTPTLTVTLSPTSTVETATPTPTGTVSGTTTPTSPTLQLEPPTLPLHQLSTTSFIITGLPGDFNVGSGTLWRAIIANQSDSTPIVTGKLAIDQNGGQTSFKVTLTAADLTKLRAQFTGATTPKLRLTFTTGDSPYRLPDVALTVEQPIAKGLPVVAETVTLSQEYTKVITTYLLSNKDKQVYTDTQGLSFVPLFKTKDLGSRDSDIEPRTGGNSFPFPYQYPLVGNGDTVLVLDEATTATTNIKVYLVQIVKVADEKREYSVRQTGWLPAVFIDGPRQQP